MTYRFTDGDFPAGAARPAWFHNEATPPQKRRAWFDEHNRRAANGEEGACAGGSPGKPSSLADEIRVSKARHRRRTGNGAQEPPISDSAEGAEGSKTAEPAGYTMTAKGLKWSSGEREDKEIICSGEFEIVAETRASDGFNWGLLLRWKSADGAVKDWAMPRSLLAGDGLEVRRALLDGGLYVAAGSKARQHLTNYLTIAHSKTRARAVGRTGWAGSAFVLPGETIGGDPDDMVILQTAHFLDHAYNVKGTLDDWKTNIARYAIGNSRLVLAICAGFAALFVSLCGGESGGVHFKGKSSEGKTTALRVGGSVWGGSDEPRGFLRSWRSTDNGLESVAATHNDALLCLDEISQLSSKAAGDCAYMLANGMGKGRASRDATLRKVAQWNLLFLSSGEISLGDKISEDPRNKRQTAGQEVRVIDLPSDGGEHGLFDELHGFENGSKFADYLISACKENYGTPIRAFIASVAPNLEEMAGDIKGWIADFVGDVCPADCSGQVRRAAARFGLIAAGGELAIRLGILPWPAGEATRAATVCFDAWVAGRGGTGAAEVRQGIERVRLFFEQYGDSRFDDMDEPAANQFGDPRPDRPVHNRAGWREGKGAERKWFILPEVWKQEICAGLDATAVARTLGELGILQPGDGGKFSRPARAAGQVRRVYLLTAAIFDGWNEVTL